MSKASTRAREAPPLDKLIGVNDIPIVLNTHLNLRGARRVRNPSVRQWWVRSRGYYGFDVSGVEFPYMASPLPAPVMVGVIQERPMWPAWRIVEWYADWKGIVNVPEGVVMRRELADAYDGEKGDVVVSVIGRASDEEGDSE